MADATRTLRAELAASLPARISAALESYHRFTADEPPADAKGFAAWQAAAKAALAHVEQLVKLARWAENGNEPDTPDSGLDALLAEARDALASFDDDEEDTE
ncbi:MAG: hypothetical protein HQL42_15990 [Alphaproteobacteria bacterium]|nr:hypothetical protein [Alphaproteobacteria bacterium]